MHSTKTVDAFTFPNPRLALQEAMVFLGAIASGMEEAVGESASNISYLAGKNLGKSLSNDIPKTDNLERHLKPPARCWWRTAFCGCSSRSRPMTALPWSWSLRMAAISRWSSGTA